MKKFISLFTIISLLFAGCEQTDVLSEDLGMVTLKVALSDDVTVKSRADVSAEDAEVLKKNCKIRVFHNNNLIQRYRDWNDIPADGLYLPVGTDYKIKVNAGDSVSASFESKYYEGIQDFVVEKNDANVVNVNCNIVNTLVKVVFDAQWNDFLSEANVVVSAAGTPLTYTWKAENGIGYFIAPADQPDLTYTFSGKTVTNKEFSYEGVLANVQKSTLYTLTFNPKSGEPTLDYDGGAFFKLTVDDTPLYTQEITDELYAGPSFEVKNNDEKVDIHSVWIPGVTDVIQPVFYIRSSTPLTEAVISSQLFMDMGLEEAGIDLLTTDIVKISALYRNGISFGVTDDLKVVKMVINNPINSYLANTPKYEFQFHAKDSYSSMGEGLEDKVTNLTFNLQMIDLNIKAIETPWYEIWSTSAVVYGAKFPGKEPKDEIVFQYRKKDGVDTWKNVAAVLQSDGVNYKSEKITNLEPSTTYEYQFVETGKEVFGLYEFTTESGKQFPNASFEDWSTSGNTKYLFKSGDKMFWDSGNQGGTTGAAAAFGSNMTTEGDDFKNSGKYSVKMVTNKVVGVVAAGNLFIGDFIGTEQTTKGIIGLGRPWDARPVALEGYIRYIPESGVNTSDIPSGVESTIKGGVDNGFIYAAIGDWTNKSYSGQSWPVIIRTADLDAWKFDKNDAGIIAYGEQTFTERITPSTPTGMQKFRINLDYRALDKKPTSIILVAAASKYGDYYVGAKGSTMWLDDLTLVYE